MPRLQITLNKYSDSSIYRREASMQEHSESYLGCYQSGHSAEGGRVDNEPPLEIIVRLEVGRELDGIDFYLLLSEETVSKYCISTLRFWY